MVNQYTMNNGEIRIRSRRILFVGLRDENVSTSTTSKYQQYILAVGRLHKEKGVDLLIDAFKRISGYHQYLSLIVIGDGPERDTCEANTWA